MQHGTPQSAPEVIIESDGTDIFVIADGVKIAKRGKANTPHAKTWIPLEPGWEVHSNADHSQISVTHNGVALQ